MKQFILFASMFTPLVSYGQLLLSESFEDYSPGKEITQASGLWHFETGIGDPYRPEPVVRTAKDGVSPYAGKQMLEARTHHKRGGANFYRSGVLFPEGTTSATISSRFLLVQGEIGDPFLSMKFTPGRTTTLDVDFSAGTLRFAGAGFANDRANYSFERNRWYEITLAYDLVLQQEKLLINGAPIFDRPHSDGTKMNAFMPFFNVAQRADVSHLYSEAVGAPFLFIDDARIVAVPEPGSMVILGLFCACANIRKRRR